MRHRLLLLVFLAALAALRLAGLGLHGLGLDEAWDLMVFALPPGDIVALLRQPPAGVLWPPPLHYLLQHALTATAGDPLLAARAASAGWSLAALALLALAARPAPRLAVAVGLALLALQPFQQYWAQQTRAYAFLQFVTVLAYIALWRWRCTGRPGWGLLTAVALTAGLYTHYYFFLVWLSCALLLVRWLWLRRLPPRAALWLLVPILLFVPWLPTMFARVTDRQATGAIRVTQPGGVARELSFLLAGPALPKSAAARTARAAALAGGLTLLLLAIWHWRKRWWLFIPVALPVSIALLVGSQVPTFAARYLIIVQAPLYALFAGALAARSTLLRRAAFAGALVHGCGLAYGTAYLASHEWPLAEDFRGAAAIIAREWQPGDAVCCVAPYMQLPMTHYLPADRVDYIDAGALPAAGRRRLWLVWSNWQYHDPEGSILTGLRAARPPAREISLTGVQLFLFAPAETSR